MGQEFTQAEKTKLAGVQAGAEVNVQADWDATSGDSEILNKPDLVEDFTDLNDTPNSLTGQGGKFVAVNSAADALELVDAPSGGGGSGSQPDPVYLPFTSDVALTPGSPADTWGAWGEVIRYTASGSRHILFLGDITATSSWGTSGGGDRAGLELRVRHMNSANVEQRVHN